MREVALSKRPSLAERSLLDMMADGVEAGAGVYWSLTSIYVREGRAVVEWFYLITAEAYGEGRIEVVGAGKAGGCRGAGVGQSDVTTWYLYLCWCAGVQVCSSKKTSHTRT